MPVGSSYIHQIVLPWNQLLHNGTVNVNLRLIWLFEPLIRLAGQVGSVTFALTNSMFLAFVAVFPLVTSFWILKRVIQNQVALVLVTLFYSFNPWITAQDSSGHVGIALAFGLIVVFAFPPPASAISKSLRTGLLFAIIFDLDPHIGAIALLCLLSTALLHRIGVGLPKLVENQIVDFRSLFFASLAALGCSLYWVIPDFVVARHLPYVPVTGNPTLSNIRSLSQFDDLYHLMGLRSFWWSPFSNGFYGHGGLNILLSIGLICGPMALIFLSLLSPNSHGSRVLPILWIAVPLLLTQCAHLLPWLYAILVSLPGGALFRDPNNALPLAILGLCLFATNIHLPPLKHLGMALLAAGVVATLVPWLTGDLNGYLAPLPSVGSQYEAISWINHHAESGASTLWLPAASYLTTDWSNGLVTDPVSFWTTVPVINPLEDPAYDFNPETTLATDDLESMLANGQSLKGLGRALAAAGVQFVVVRLDSLPHSVPAQYRRSLLEAQGVHLVRKFGDQYVYQMPGPIRNHATITQGISLFDGTWGGLEQALYLDPNDHNTYVNLSSILPNSNLLTDPRNILLTDDLLSSTLSLGNSTPIANTISRQELIAGNEPMYLFERNQTFSTPSVGLFAVNILGINQNTSEFCDGSRITQLIVNQQPDVGNLRYSTRWLGFMCTGTATIRFNGPVWVGRMQTLPYRDYLSRLVLIERLMSHPGSTYMLHSDQFSSTSNESVRITDDQDLLYLTAGKYHISLSCNNFCSSDHVRLLAAANLRPVTPWLTPGASMTIVANHGGNGFYNEYRLAVESRNLSQLDNVYIQRSPRRVSGTVGSVSTRNAESLTFRTSQTDSVLRLLGSPSPWTFSGEASKRFGPLPANIFGNAIGITGRTGTLDLSYLYTIERICAFVSGGTVLAIILSLLTPLLDRRRSSRHRL
ncbi:MAG: DUF3367 domain-containing protein [Acidobacteria bacterium]|nr:DUF3367 domain-containing protein [Acidobacteriota bacterium]